MKNIFVLLTLAILISEFSCNDSILSKFIQHGYKIKDKRTELVSYNKSIFDFIEFKTFKYNRTTTAHNATFKPIINLDDKIEILVQVYKFLSNEYRHFPIRFQLNLKKAYDSNAIGLSNLAQCGNMTDFIFSMFQNVVYHFGNWVIDETRFPPLIPNGMYKVEVTLLFLNKEIALVYLFVTKQIYKPIDYPKK